VRQDRFQRTSKLTAVEAPEVSQAGYEMKPEAGETALSDTSGSTGRPLVG
jgi:hypothetical protein